MTVSAPGKLLLLGDYAVLEGGTALVAAVDRRAVGSLQSDGPGPSPVVASVIEAARRAGHEVDDALVIDTTSFHDAQGRKLGLGSSAAVAVVTAALATGRGDERTLAIAIEGHRAAAGGKGSGVDVAACFYGGVISAAHQPGPVDVLPSRLPGLRLSVLFTGASADTPTLVEACRRSSRWSTWLDVILNLSRQGLEAYGRQERERFLSVVARYGRAMAGMGRDAGVPVVTKEIQAVMTLAEEGRGAAKPSGAGGGDVVVMWSHDPDLPQRIAEKTGCTLLDLAVDPKGLVRQPRSL